MSSVADSRVRARLTICGAVQGVGFRPYVYRLAKELGLAGWVQNSSQGVALEVEGTDSNMEQFLVRIEPEKPPRSFIQSLETVWLAPIDEKACADDFEIRESDSSGAKKALVLPDIAPCPECLREIFAPANRRFGYPFTNCTHCGPRFSIIEKLPYDRAHTTMRKFEMCADCRREFEDPCDRRFHAQPNACPVCGPQIEWWTPKGDCLATRDEALTTAAEAIHDGAIVAVKGVGGFHLIVDARNEDAVMRLRHAKNREEKPLAVMVSSLEMARAECEISDLEERLLRSPEAPIVLLRHRGNSITPSVAPGNPFLGVMLPSTPLHHLLMARLGFPIVATSGNRSDEPICIDETEALERLNGITDFFLVHNRPIVRHVDDSVARVILGRELILRRARGYAPLLVRVVTLGSPTSIIATGAHLKNTIALSNGDSAFISQHLGDLDTAPAFTAFKKVIADFQELYETTPQVIAADAHPDYLSTKAAAELAQQNGTPLLPVQHHFAHVLSCMAENETAPPALGVAWDGTGYGLDGTIWGGEFLDIQATGFTRFAHLRTFPLPGGEAAVKEPRRCALGLLYEMLGEDVFAMPELMPLRAFSTTELANLRTMLRKGINTPRTSSMGRFFDAVASLTGVRQFASFEGQAAMEWEWKAGTDQQAFHASYPFEIHPSNHAAALIIDWEPIIQRMLADLRANLPHAELSAKFHQTLIEIILQIARRSKHLKIVLSGGCFQNERLITLAVRQLSEEGFRPIWHQRVPPNDGGIALGQISAAMMQIHH